MAQTGLDSTLDRRAELMRMATSCLATCHISLDVQAVHYVPHTCLPARVSSACRMISASGLTNMSHLDRYSCGHRDQSLDWINFAVEKSL